MHQGNLGSIGAIVPKLDSKSKKKKKKKNKSLTKERLGLAVRCHRNVIIDVIRFYYYPSGVIDYDYDYSYLDLKME